MIGGGITGLAAAHRLVELDPSLQLTLFEASAGRSVSHTVPQDGFLIELAADNFITTVPWAIDLCKRIGEVAAERLINDSASHSIGTSSKFKIQSSSRQCTVKKS
ncbi:MAG: NAD(P)-binding protein [Candidatus Paceibacterota bacterium]